MIINNQLIFFIFIINYEVYHDLVGLFILRSSSHILYGTMQSKAA